MNVEGNKTDMETYLKSIESTSQNHIEQIRELLPSAVLLPTPDNTKAPRFQGWQGVTFEQTQDAAFRLSYGYRKVLYADELPRAGIAVSLGKVSGGLCTIDFDSAEMAEKFLQLNPKLQHTMRTCRVRGQNIWLRMTGTYPRFTNLKTKIDGRETHVGEWRADGHCTMIHGRVQDMKKGEKAPTCYRFLSRVAPLEIDYTEIIWPAEIIPPAIEEQLNFEDENSSALTIPFVCVPAFLPSCPTSLLYNERVGPADCLKINRNADKSLAERHPSIKKLYDRYIEPRFRAAPRGRNDFVCDSAPFLSNTVGMSVGLELMMHFYLTNKSHFAATPNEHQRSCVAALKAAVTTFFASLSADERAAYGELSDERELDTFRICRDLALYNSSRQAGGQVFFLSHDDLGARLGIEAMQAWRVMKKFLECGLIAEVEKGQPHRKGLRSDRATSWRWLLPVPSEAVASANPEKRSGLGHSIDDSTGVRLRAREDADNEIALAE